MNSIFNCQVVFYKLPHGQFSFWNHTVFHKILQLLYDWSHGRFVMFFISWQVRVLWKNGGNQNPKVSNKRLHDHAFQKPSIVWLYEQAGKLLDPNHVLWCVKIPDIVFWTSFHSKYINDLIIFNVFPLYACNNIYLTTSLLTVSPFHYCK